MPNGAGRQAAWEGPDTHPAIAGRPASRAGHANRARRGRRDQRLLHAGIARGSGRGPV